MNYEGLERIIENTKKHNFIIGVGGSGKTHIIKNLKKKRNDIISVAPSGIAAQNIDGRTIQSYFGIPYHTYSYNGIVNINDEKIKQIKEANILLIDEVSMVSSFLLDIINSKLQCVKNNNKPFGGLKVLLFADMNQLEPVITDDERQILYKMYPENNNSYYFYNADCLKNNYFESNFDIYELQHDFRHQEDAQFSDILNQIRNGYCSEENLQTLNTKCIDSFKLLENYQYLTISNNTSNRNNERFIESLPGNEYIIQPEINTIIDSDMTNKKLKQIRNNIELRLKENMKIMFIHNDSFKNGNRWYNGSIGHIKKINHFKNKVISVIVEMENKEQYEITPETRDVSLPANPPYDMASIILATITQFPFVPSYSITIDKSQGLTLNKVYIVIDSDFRDNQVYVALSRARKLEDILLSRPITSADIHLSSEIKLFNDHIKNRIIPVYKNKAENIINIKNVHTVNIYNHF
jgi:hypothetical protein